MKRLPRRRIGLWAALTAVAVAVAVYLLAVQREPPPPHPGAGASTSSLLALTWGPSLCALDRSNSGCRSGHVGRLGQVFLLHGLWPQPSSEQYCDVPRKSADRKPALALPDDLRSTLQTRMSDASVLAPHEWYAHGTCSGVTPPEYFQIAAGLTEQANTVLDPLFAAARGRDISVRTVRAAFDARFGSGAGQRVALSCRDGGNGKAMAYEVRLSLPAVAALRDAGGPVSLRDVLAGAPAVAPGCGRGSLP